MEATRASIRRARPLLGIFGEIAVAGTAVDPMEAAGDAECSALAMEHRLPGSHEANSDVSRLNRGDVHMTANWKNEVHLAA